MFVRRFVCIRIVQRAMQGSRDEVFGNGGVRDK